LPPKGSGSLAQWHRTLPKLARPADVANAIVFLASDRLAGHVTGQTMVVAGGMEGRWLWPPVEIDVAVA